MAVTINGSGTITGVSAGGLPDNCITADDLASTLDISGKTVTLPSNVGGITTGKVLQVVSSRFTGQGSISTDSTARATNPSITKSITPVGTGSNFLIKIRWMGEATNNESTVAHIERSGLGLLNQANNSSYHGISYSAVTGNHTDNDSTPNIMYVETLDETGSTAGTSITYTLQFTANSGTLWTNRCFGNSGATHYETGVSEIIITEIGA